MPTFKRILTFLSLFFTITLSTGCIAANLVISDKLAVSYSKPNVIAHTQNSLILKYEGWWFSHEIVDAEGMYPGMDLSEHLPQFIRSIFDAKIRKSLSSELSALSEEQAKIFGVTRDNVKREKRGAAELMAIYDVKSNRGDVYVIEERMIQHMEMFGSEAKFAELISNIKER